MICEECGQNRPLTYRSEKLKKRSVCAPCIRANHADTLNADGTQEATRDVTWEDPYLNGRQRTIG